LAATGPGARPGAESIGSVSRLVEIEKSYAPPVSGAELRSARMGAMLGRPVNAVEVVFFLVIFFLWFSFLFIFLFFSFLQF
jgi:hypothetical protein